VQAYTWARMEPKLKGPIIIWYEFGPVWPKGPYERLSNFFVDYASHGGR